MRPLKQAIAARYGVDPDCVVTAAGTSMANYLAFATLLDPGDEVLIEHPTYGLLVDALRVRRRRGQAFRAPHESGYALDPEAVRRAITPKTRLIVVTNLHNPSSVLTPETACLREIGEIARSVGARVLVDEVYLDAVYENTPRTSLPPGPAVRGDQQPDQGVRRERPALRLDSGGAGPGARHVAAERSVRGDSGASRGTAERGGLREPGCRSRAVPPDRGGGPARC